MDVRILGPLAVELESEPLELGGHKQRGVLAVLLLHAGEVVSPDRLADAVWDGEPPPSVDSTLRGYVSNLRKALEPERGPKDEPRVLRTTPGGYVLDLGDEAIDARRFERLAAEGTERRATDVRGAAEVWAEALALWRGDAFQDFAYEEFVQNEASRLAELRWACTEDLLDARIECGHHDAVVGDLEAFCSAHPERERALGLRMLALYRCGRQSEALEAYEEGRRRLADELGIDPSTELRELHERILRQDPTLAASTPAEPPSGKQTLTFLLGDVELSTEKLRALGDDYAGALEEHRRILREGFEAHGGRAIRTYGDEAFAAFDGATDAMAAAVAAQVALGRAVPDETRRLPVRMGLHTGEATFSGGEYVGLAVHLAARIMDAANGGQILVSGATKELFEAEEGTAVELLDTGMHTLKDIPGAVRLFQVVHPELRRDFPQLRTRSGRSDNLPTRLTSFVGRERDIEEIEASLEEARVVTLTGVGGVGKTRLAVEAGRRLGSRYPDGVWLCELAPVGDEDAVVHSIASTLGVDPQVGRSVRESLLGALRQHESLVILDNCEHLLAPVAELVEEVVHDARSVDVIVTSREVLGVEGERARPVRSLSVGSGESDEIADSMRLFEDRARAARPDFTLDGRNAADVADVCARLDGIPLAIELAAARIASLSPAQIASRLEEGFHFLRSGRRAAVDRHRTLHGAIDWSYAMLSEAERLLFDRLSVFAGGFTLEAAEDVCGRDLPLDVADGLASLVAKSMVDADVSGDEARYDLLETMRQYAQDRLAECEEADGVLHAHAAYYVRLLEDADWQRGESERVVPRLVLEFENLRAAWAWARASGDVDLALRVVSAGTFLSFQFQEMYGWAEEALAMPGAEEHELFPVALVAVRRASTDPEVLRERTIRALELVDDSDDSRRLWPLIGRVFVAFSEGDMEGTRRWRAEYLRVARVHGEPMHEVFAHAAGSMAESNFGDHAAATELAETGYRLARGWSSAVQGLALYYLGEALLAAGEELGRALDCLERGIALFRANGMYFWEGVSLVASASLRARHGDPLEALRMFDGVIDRWRRLGDWTRQWVTLLNLVELFGRLGADEAAAVLLAAAEDSEAADPGVGAQGERLATLRDELAERLGAEAFAAATERGRAMTDAEAVACAKAEIDRALEEDRADV